MYALSKHKNLLEKGVVSILPPTTELWGKEPVI